MEQEEYCDQVTLEARLQAVARIMIQRQGMQQGRGGAASTASRQQMGALFSGVGGNMPHVQQQQHQQQQQMMMAGNRMLPNGAPILRGAAAAQGQYMGGSSQMMAGVPPGTMIPTPGVGNNAMMGTGMAPAAKAPAAKGGSGRKGGAKAPARARARQPPCLRRCPDPRASA